MKLHVPRPKGRADQPELEAVQQVIKDDPVHKAVPPQGTSHGHSLSNIRITPEDQVPGRPNGEPAEGSKPSAPVAGEHPATSGILDEVQMGLTVLGMVPGIGEFANAASGVISLAQGDWAGAALSAAAMIPGVGEAADAAKITRLGGKAVREGEEIAHTVQTGEKLTHAATSTEHSVAEGKGAVHGGTVSEDAAAALPPAQAPGRTTLSDAFGGKTPTAEEVENWAKENGWTRSQTPTGPVKYTDEKGVVRATIKQGSPRTPGSELPHVELRNHTGQRIDSSGNAVTRKSPSNHTPIK